MIVTEVPRSRFRTALVLALGLLLSVFTGFYNIGIIALDDYSNEISTSIPAQSQPKLEEWIHHGVHPPLGRLVVCSVAQLFHHLGAEDPALQLRFTLALLALVNFSISSFLFLGLCRGLSEEKTAWGVLLFGFYFINPLIFSRPMIESLSIPFLLASCLYARRYFEARFPQDGPLPLVLSLALLAAGCLLRPQIGTCAVVIGLLPLLLRRYRDFGLLVLTGIACIILTGAVDVALGKKFHGTLIEYVRYNAIHGAGHGVTPFYSFLLLFLGLSLPPAFLSRYRGFSWRAEYQALLIPLLYFVSFVFAHSLFVHKEERFMIPVIPIFVLLLTPLLAHFQRQRQRWRLWYFGSLNCVLLFLVVTQVPQGNAIEAVRYVGENPSFEEVASFEDSIVLWPLAYSVGAAQKKLMRADAASIASDWPCTRALVVRLDKSDRFRSLPQAETFTIRKTFAPGLIDKLLIWANPTQNQRRGQLELWRPAQCQ